MSWKDKLVGATVIYELLIVIPVAWLGGDMTSLWSQLFSPSFDYSLIARVIIVIVLNGFYGMGLLLIMGLIDFARRPKREPTTGRFSGFKSMEIGRE